MLRRSLPCLAIAAILAGCTSHAPRTMTFGMPRLPSLPSLDLFRDRAGEAGVETFPFKLSGQNLADVKSDFSSAFTDGRSLTFGPVGARRKTDGTLLVCGLVSVRGSDDRETGMRLFDGHAAFDPFGALRFEPRRLAGENGSFLDIYDHCRTAQVI